MTTSVCPYCRAPISPETEEVSVCPGCDTPHHRDCFEENRGCTVFGCSAAPPEEPKLLVSTPDLSGVRMATAPATAPTPLPNYLTNPPITLGGYSTSQPDVALEYKNKTTFIILGVLLGALGGHNFYAGFRKKGLYQLCLTIFTLGYGAPMSWIWAIIDICTIDEDSKGNQFRS